VCVYTYRQGTWVHTVLRIKQQRLYPKRHKPIKQRLRQPSLHSALGRHGRRQLALISHEH